MRLISTILWLIFGGLITALLWFVFGVLLCITIVGIPFGKQCFKFAKLSLMPFGKKVRVDFEKHPIMNLIWLVLFGWELMLCYLAATLLCFITIIGIPKGIQIFKFSKLSLAPFGAKITKGK